MQKLRSNLSLYSLDLLIIVLLHPLLNFIFTVAESPVLLYLQADYTKIYFLMIALLVRMEMIRGSIDYLLPIVFVFMAASIEFFHFYINGYSLNGLTDIRMILYSPLYAPMIVASVYLVYLAMSGCSIQRLHVQYFVAVTSLFSVFFVVYWILLFYGVVPKIESANLLNQNHYSYTSLAVLFLLLFFSNVLHLSPRRFFGFFLINVLVIVLNTTRGAELILLSLLVYKFYEYNKFNLGAGLTNLLMFVGLLLISVAIYTSGIVGRFFGGDMVSLLKHFQDVANVGNINYGTVIELSNGLTQDDSSISSAVRIYANVINFQVFIENFFMGVGSAFAYSLKVHTSNVHSFLFLYPASGGMVGLLMLYFAWKSSIYALKGIDRKWLVLMFFAGLFLFNNNVPYYIVLIVFAASLSSMWEFKRPFYSVSHRLLNNHADHPNGVFLNP